MDPVHLEISRFLRAQGISRGARILVAVSGGADSVTLLHALVALDQRVGVGHVHHGLREAGAEADLDFVRELAAGLGLPFRASRVDARRRDGRSPEARARELRYSALETLCSDLGCAWIATAHSLDDQAETVLLRAVRGTGLRGLAGIDPRAEGARLLRPLLGVRATALREYLKSRGLCWREDETNADRTIPRNRLRAEILPALEQVHAGATRKLAQLAETARQSEAEGQGRVERALERALSVGDGGFWIEPRELDVLGSAGRRRALSSLLGKVGLASRVTTVHLQRMETFLDAASGRRSLSLPALRLLVRDGARVWLGEAPGPRFPAPIDTLARPPETLEFPERGVRLSWRQGGTPTSSCDTLHLPARPAPLLRIRSPRPGDRIALPGRCGAKPLADLFGRARWSRSQRARALVVEAGGRAIWVPGLTGAPALSGGPAEGWQLVFERLSTGAES